MKFRCGRWRRLYRQFWDGREEAREKWHKWFAWYPVNVGYEDCRWLEVVNRKEFTHTGTGELWMYRTYKIWRYEAIDA